MSHNLNGLKGSYGHEFLVWVVGQLQALVITWPLRSASEHLNPEPFRDYIGLCRNYGVYIGVI